MKPKIIAAAIRHRGIVFTGVRHGDIIQQIVRLDLLTEAERPITAEQQGFIDNGGTYYQRNEARDIAVQSGQIKPTHGTLYSEDLW
jgi:hypothetical protein